MKIYQYLPTASDGAQKQEAEPVSIHADAPCPCCKNITIPNGGEALAYICPVCLWEIDFFISAPDEPSDLNHGLTLYEAQENYRTCGAVLPRLTQYARPPRDDEIPADK